MIDIKQSRQDIKVCVGVRSQRLEIVHHRYHISHSIESRGTQMNATSSSQL